MCIRDRFTYSSQRHAKTVLMNRRCNIYRRIPITSIKKQPDRPIQQPDVRGNLCDSCIIVKKCASVKRKTDNSIKNRKDKIKIIVNIGRKSCFRLKMRLQRSKKKTQKEQTPDDARSFCLLYSVFCKIISVFSASYPEQSGRGSPSLHCPG